MNYLTMNRLQLIHELFELDREDIYFELKKEIIINSIEVDIINERRRDND